MEWLADARWGETTEVRFDVACIAATLHVTTTTTGVSLDPDGYSVCVDLDPWQDGCAYESAIGVNGGALKNDEATYGRSLTYCSS